MNTSAEAGSYSLSDPMTVLKLEHIYHEPVLEQDFYSDSYGCEWTPEPYEDMAKMLRDVIALTKHVDGGCRKRFSRPRYACVNYVEHWRAGDPFVCVFSPFKVHSTRVRTPWRCSCGEELKSNRIPQMICRSFFA